MAYKRRRTRNKKVIYGGLKYLSRDKLNLSPTDKKRLTQKRPG